jgi:methyl-accepting chemotaxis protein
MSQLPGSVNSMHKHLKATISSVLSNAVHIAHASKKFLTVSRAMHSNSEEVSTQAQAVFAATEEVNRNLENVANATGQMSTTIRDTAKNAPEAARIAGEARARAADTNTIIINLGDSVAKIEEVIKVVTSIAHEKNLLALTATIEAARAGEVGAGFAVVASEGKELARQTAASAEEISGSIGHSR